MSKKNLISSYGIVDAKSELAALGTNTLGLRDLDGDTLKIKSVMLYEQPDNLGGVKEVVYVEQGDGLPTYATISPTFIDSLINIMEWGKRYNGRVRTIKVLKKEGKRGRPFFLAELGDVEGV